MLKGIAKDGQPFTTTVGDEAMFGPEKDVPVRLVKKTSELMRLHSKLYFHLSQAGCLLENDEYTRENFMPHVTVRGDRHIARGAKVLVESIDIVENLDDGKMGRKVVKRFNFSKKS